MKINDTLVISNGLVAFDGCHKFYIIEDGDDQNMMLEYDYNLYDISQLPHLYETACPLKFIHNAKLTKTYAEQCELVTFE